MLLHVVRLLISNFLLVVKGLCIEKSSKTEPVDFEPLVDKGTGNNLVINLLCTHVCLILKTIVISGFPDCFSFLFICLVVVCGICTF